MSKVIKIVALVAIAAAVVVFAAPIAGAIAGLGAAVGIGAGVASAALISSVVGIGLSIGLSAIGMAFRKAPSMSPASELRLNARVDPTTSRKVVFGTTAAGADERFYETYGSKKDAYAQVIALASHRVSAIREFHVEDDLTWSGGALVAHADGITSFRAVTEGTSANGQALGSGAYWTASSTFTGCAYLALTYKLDPKAWPQGIPSKITTVVDGCPLYDPRLDSSTGGSGSHRVADQATWEFNHGGVQIGRNPALALLTYLIGYRINGVLAWGMGVPATSINFDNFRSYANVCEEQVLLAGGGTVQRYTCDAIFSTSDSHETIISAITASMGSCKMTDVCGQYQLVGGYDDTLGPIQAYTVSDLVGAPGSPAPYVWRPAGPARDSVNLASGKFADPAQLYQLNTWGAVETEPLADGVPRPLTLDLGCVSRPETCQRIAKQFLARDALCPGMFSATFGPRGFAVQVGSLLTLSIPQEGWNAKLFRVEEHHEVHDMIYQMTLREESAAVYAWDREEKPLPANIRPGGYDAGLAFPVQGMSVSSVTYEGVA